MDHKQNVEQFKGQPRLLKYLSESQFLSTGLYGEALWFFPITLALGSYDRGRNFLFELKFDRENVSELFYSSDEKNQDEYSEISWVKVHVEQSGVHRVESGDERAARLRKTIENNYFQQQINTV
ncbi:Uncharacterized protein TCM_029093 [Theobroma cacao]|uniref:Uncharacterized protein n=1 Tax=Theobroma cacao TaxID=3641 RepID=A0A061GCA6_THECC|nr:Uncharacterized protein TCM_029093 [Theobroma cacao]